MKKLALLLSILICSINFLSSEEYKYIYKDFKKKISLPKLEKNECFDISHDSGILTIYKISGTNKEKYYSEEVKWGHFQISEDKTKVVFLLYDPIELDTDNVFPMYLLDGIKGELEYICHMYPYFRTSYDFIKIAYVKHEYNTEVIEIFDVPKKEIIKKYRWESQEGYYESDYSWGIDIFRSKDSDYGFRIFSTGEGGYIYKEGYISSNSDKIFELPEKTIKDIRELSKKEAGR